MPEILIMGFLVPVVTLGRRTFSVAGDNLRQLIRVQCTSSGKNCFQKRYHDLGRSLGTFSSPKGMMEHYFFPSNTDIDVIFQLYNYSNQLNYHLTAASFARDPFTITGYVMSRSLPDDLTASALIHPRVLFFLVRSAQLRTPPSSYPWDFSSSIDELEASFRTELYSAVCLFFSSAISEIVVGYCDVCLDIDNNDAIHSDHTHLLRSPDVWWWIFFRTIIFEKVPDIFRPSLSSVATELLDTPLIHDATWSYSFFGKPKHVYWWHAGRRVVTLMTTPPPQSLSLLQTALKEPFPILEYLTEILPAVYGQSQHLNWHRDRTGEKFFGHPETVQLFFSGQPRALKFKPTSSSVAQKLRMVISVQCSEGITIRLTPMGNTFFKHSKARSNSRTSSVTLAFRKGVPIKNAQALYPYIQQLQDL